METYADRNIEPEDIKVFHQIKKVVENLVVPNLGYDEGGRKIELSCHMLAEVISEFFGLKCLNGYYMRGWNHSWLVTRNRNIIDVYPIGVVGGPILVAHQLIHKGGPIYIEDNQLDFGQNKPLYKKSVELVRIAVYESIVATGLNL